MHTNNRILRSQITTSPHQSIHPIFHLGIPALYGVKVQCGIFARLHPGGGGASPDADAVARSSDLDDEHALFGFALGRVSAVQRANAGGEHDGLDPFESLSAGNAHTEASGESVNHGLAEFVAVIARAIARLHLDLQRTGQVGRVFERIVLPRQCVSRDVQVSDAVRAHSRDGVGTPSGGHDIPQSASGAGLGSREGCHRTRKVMRLRR
mmetsp:Transcript_36056/g.64935  ORF Transcript_36056/g.64935 Transcript_36056/m.64935 type:complete len:209 (-) Transcript_36056:1082-1708(-)